MVCGWAYTTFYRMKVRIVSPPPVFCADVRALAHELIIRTLRYTCTTPMSPPLQIPLGLRLHDDMGQLPFAYHYL